MSRPIDNCFVCVAHGNNMNVHHFLRDREATETVAGLAVHSNGCKRDAEVAIRFWNDGSAEWRDGAYRWKSNGSVPNADMILTWLALGYITADEAERSVEAREADTTTFLKAYRKNPPKVTAEERAEMRAAFGEGETVVNILTGKKIRL